MLLRKAKLVQSPKDDEPKTIQKALSNPTSDKRKKTMEKAMQSMKVNKVWTLVNLSQGRNAIGNK